jgi:hypothetical protein
MDLRGVVRRATQSALHLSGESDFRIGSMLAFCTA